MKNQMRWLALVAGFVTLIAGSLGCATMAATSAANNHTDFYNRPVSSDEISAIGRVDAALPQPAGKNATVALFGQKNAYLLDKGGEELESIARLKLDGKLLRIDSACGCRLYLKDKQVWGTLALAYGDGASISSDEQAELERAGFAKTGSGKYIQYQKKIDIKGTVYPPIKASDGQAPQLALRGPLNLHNPQDAKPPTNIGATLMVPVAVVADIVLIPVYLGVGIIALLGSR